MEHAYHLLLNGRQEGPFSVRELQHMLATAEILPGHLAWRPGLSGWMPVGQVIPPPLPASSGMAPSGPPALPVHPPRRRRGIKASTIWTWVTAGVVAMVGTIGVFVYFGVKQVRNVGTDTVSYRPLFEDRAGHVPEWQASSFEAVGPADEPDGTDLTLIRYRSPAGELAAYLTPDPNDGKKHPAMVWAHGGFGGIGSYFWEEAGKRDDQSARAFREKGIVLMCPSWRGENDNPGRFELFYGEVDDLLAAVAHVKSLPYVDPERVYLGGHSTGGTLVLLAAGASESFRAAFSFGGLIDGVSMLEDDGYDNRPYHPKSGRDHRLRSPMRYAAFLRRPVFYFEGEEDYESVYAARMRSRSRGRFHPFQVPGDHFDILHPVTGLIAEKILADTGPETAIHFTDEELTDRYRNAFSITLAGQLDQWIKDGGDLGSALNVDDPEDVVPRTLKDIDAVATAIGHLEGTKEIGRTTIAALAVLADLRDDIEEDEIIEAFDARATGRLVAWARARLDQSPAPDEPESEPLFSLLATLAGIHDPTTADLVVDAVTGGKLPATSGWTSVFRSFDTEHPHTDKVMRALSENLPDGLTGVLLLDAANSLCLDDWKGTHPFDTASGASRMRQWLEGTDPDTCSYAHSAALGSAFLSPAHRGDLISMGLRHPDRGVRLEAAWSDAKVGGTDGLARLREACLDVHQSRRAQNYLEELKHEAEIPHEAKDPAFVAQATMSRWLQHPNELNADPLSLEVVDHRSLHWPPTEDQRELWLIKFTYQFPNQPGPKTGYGCVGSMTWSSFQEFAATPAPEELYLHHCALEMQRGTSRTEAEAKKQETKKQALEALQKSNPGVFDTLVIPDEAAGEDEA